MAPTYGQDVVVSFERCFPCIKQMQVEEDSFTQVLDPTRPIQVSCLQTWSINQSYGICMVQIHTVSSTCLM